MTKEDQLKSLNIKIKNCNNCQLSKTRKNAVCGIGNLDTDIIFLGEAPGETEDDSGLPFVGRSGKLLTSLLKELNIERTSIFITNVNKCRPPNNRQPSSEEILSCKPFLLEQLNIIKPKVICALGKTAAIGLGLMKKSSSLKDYRNKLHDWNNIKVLITFHPSYLLRDPRQKDEFRRDIQIITKYLNTA